MECAADALALLDRYAPVRFTPASEIRKTAIKPFLKRGGQRKALPKFVAKIIRDEYAARGTLGATAKAFGISRNWAGDILRNNRMGVGKAIKRPILMHNGVKYTFDGRRDYWQTQKKNRGKSLRREIWKERHGPVPPGLIVVLLNGNYADFSDENLRAIPRSQLGPMISAAIRAKTRPASSGAAASELATSRRSRAGR